MDYSSLESIAHIQLSISWLKFFYTKKSTAKHFFIWTLSDLTFLLNWRKKLNMSSQTSKQKNSFEVRAFHFTPSEFFKDLNLTIKKARDVSLGDYLLQQWIELRPMLKLRNEKIHIGQSSLIFQNKSYQYIHYLCISIHTLHRPITSIYLVSHCLNFFLILPKLLWKLDPKLKCQYH